MKNWRVGIVSVWLLFFAVIGLAQQPVNVANTPAVTQSGGPWTVNLTQIAGGALGATSNYGTSPGAVAVMGVNSFVTNTVANNIAQVNGVALGSPSNYGTSPGAVSVMGVNAFVTNAASIGTPVPNTSSANAFTLKHSSSAAAANVKASAGNLYGLVLGNSGTTACWLQLFNNAGTPTAGTSVIDSFMVQAGVTVVIPAAVLAWENFATGIAFAGATTDSGATTTGCTTSFSVSVYYN